MKVQSDPSGNGNYDIFDGTAAIGKIEFSQYAMPDSRWIVTVRSNRYFFADIASAIEFVQDAPAPPEPAIQRYVLTDGRNVYDTAFFTPAGLSIATAETERSGIAANWQGVMI